MQKKNSNEKNYIGLMSGTSADGIDAVLVCFSSPRKLELKAAHKHAFPNEVRAQIQALIQSDRNDLEAAAELDIVLGELFADAAHDVLERANMPAKQLSAIGSHGQTLRHRPNSKHPFSIQIGNPAVIAARTGITTVANFRIADIAAGGQGAPLVPAFHRWMFQATTSNRVIVNIGGIANVSYLPRNTKSPVRGFDTGPGNTLLDSWIYQQSGKTLDAEGQWAASGRSSPELLRLLLGDPYFQIAPPKSTGREYFHLDWLRTYMEKLPHPVSAQDVQATLGHLTAQSIGQAIRTWLADSNEVYVCGGGSHNRHLMAILKENLAGASLKTTEALGLHPDWVEATAFAWLAHRALAGKPGNLPSVTGAKKAVILGGIYKAGQ